MPDREVVITGMGLVTPLGNGVHDNWKKILENKTGIAQNPDNDLPKPFQCLGRIGELDIPEDIPPKVFNQMKFLNRGSLLGFAAAYEAMSQSEINISHIPAGRRALYIASGNFTNVGCEFMYPATKDGSGGKWKEMNFEKLNRATINKVNPFFLLESINNNLFSFLSAIFEFMGPNTSLASLSPYGGQALDLACKSIKQDKADIALAVGCGNWITEVPVYELEGLGLLSKCKAGVHSFKPFDRGRDGFIPGEGGAAILLEDAVSAKKRGTSIYGSPAGFGNCIEFSETQGLSVPARAGKRGMELALQEAGCGIKDLAFINPHGSGTQKGDRSEMRSVTDLLGKHNSETPVCGMKAYTGHMGAASDIAEIIFGVQAVRNGIVPGTMNFQETEMEFRGLSISSSRQACEGNHFLSVSYGMGGQSSAAVVRVKSSR